MVEEKLDRILITDTWLSLFEGAKACSLISPYSNHLPILITPEVVNTVRRRRRFCFDNMWLKEVNYREMVKHSWDKTIGMDVLLRITVCSQDIWRWGHEYNRDFLRKIEGTKAKFERLRTRRDSVATFILEQRAKEHWWKGGDSNTKYFHNSVKMRKRRNKVHKLQNEDGVWIDNADAIGSVMVDYFQLLFTATKW
ncbi:uncharacterized protein LOC116003873 [Ipomoea triloba]|uniref:uncharacterized protein LOC116003873 n=1 Tax=Ipomoea triloba TaxID=35885 RepID=UPI00125E6AA9|nr:uncharacterized protein LOC116003873 [Ipomoea triloba]